MRVPRRRDDRWCRLLYRTDPAGTGSLSHGVQAVPAVPGIPFPALILRVVLLEKERRKAPSVRLEDHGYLRDVPAHPPRKHVRKDRVEDHDVEIAVIIWKPHRARVKRAGVRIVLPAEDADVPEAEEGRIKDPPCGVDQRADRVKAVVASGLPDTVLQHGGCPPAPASHVEYPVGRPQAAEELEACRRLACHLAVAEDAAVAYLPDIEANLRDADRRLGRYSGTSPLRMTEPKRSSCSSTILPIPYSSAAFR